ncbi:MAG: M1 family peptidase [Candidatus Aminicenantes bacterium]|nr:M1 family peptidase [Candidatus Aminicenantes bacterium]
MTKTNIKKYSVLFFTFLFIATGASADFYPKNQNIDVQSYIFKVKLSGDSDDIQCQAVLDVKFLKNGIDEFYLDLVDKESRDDGKGMVIAGIYQNGKELDFTHKNDRVGVSLGEPVKLNETLTFTINYSGVPADGLIIGENRHGEQTFFGDAWPNRARHWLICVDHPSDKAICEFIIDAPAHFQVVANGILAEKTDLPDNRRLTHWKTTVPIPTKVMVIGVAHFAVQNAGYCNGTPIESWVYSQDREAGFQSFAPAVQITNFFNDLIGPFAFGKLANVQSKTRFGGMENSSCIFYSEKSVLRESIEGLLAHEIAHQWFGDAISEADWHHIWISEGFATYFTLVFMEFTYGSRRMTEGMERSRTSVISSYYKRPDSALVDTTITDPMRLLSTNSYSKGAWILHMLRNYLGDDVFWTGIRKYYLKFMNKNVVSEDFQEVMEKVSGKDLSWYFKQWLYQPGQPKYTGHWTYDKTAKELYIKLDQVQENGLLFRMPVEFGIYTEDKTLPTIKTLDIKNMENEFSFSLEEEPREVVIDPNINLLMEAEFGEKRQETIGK